MHVPVGPRLSGWRQQGWMRTQLSLDLTSLGDGTDPRAQPLCLALPLRLKIDMRARRILSLALAGSPAPAAGGRRTQAVPTFVSLVGPAKEEQCTA